MRLVRYQKKLGNIQQKIYENARINTADFHKVGATEFFIQWSWYRSFWRILFTTFYILWVAGTSFQPEGIQADMEGGRRREGTHHPTQQRLSTLIVNSEFNI